MDKKYRKASFREGALSSETSQSKKAEAVSERAGVDPMQFRHPKIFMDVLTVYKMYYHKHEALPKIFRVTIGTEIMKEISSCLRLIVLANLKRVSKEDFADSYQSVKELRGAIELIKSYFLIGWEMKFFSHGFYIQLPCGFLL
jgi:hypothetical protein